MAIPEDRVNCLVTGTVMGPLGRSLKMEEAFVLTGSVSITGIPAAVTEPYSKPEGCHCLNLKGAESGAQELDVRCCGVRIPFPSKLP